MIIKMSKQEFQELRNIVIAMDNPDVTKHFNSIFEKESKFLSVNPTTKELTVSLPKEKVCQVERSIAKRGRNLGKLLKDGVNLSSATRWFSTVDSIWSDIVSLFR